MQKIPRNIHLIYKDHHIPPDYAGYLKSIHDFHASWNIRVYGDEEARDIVADQMPGLINAYNKYDLDIQRADLFRLIVVYLYGGFYMDLDMLCLKSIDALCDNKLVLGEEKTLTIEECGAIGLRHCLRIANYMFGAVPGHPFWLDVIREAINRSSAKVICEEDVLEMTGPGLLTDVFHNVRHKYNDITLLLNKNNQCRRLCARYSCHFGDFAAHLHQGKWRWQ